MFADNDVVSGYYLELLQAYRFMRKRLSVPPGFHVTRRLIPRGVQRACLSQRTGPTGRYRPWIYVAPFVRANESWRA